MSQGEHVIRDMCNSFNVISLFLYFEDTFRNIFISHTMSFHKRALYGIFDDAGNIFIFSASCAVNFHCAASYQVKARNEFILALKDTLKTGETLKNFTDGYTPKQIQTFIQLIILADEKDGGKPNYSCSNNKYKDQGDMFHEMLILFSIEYLTSKYLT